MPEPGRLRTRTRALQVLHHRQTLACMVVSNQLKKQLRLYLVEVQEMEREAKFESLSCLNNKLSDLIKRLVYMYDQLYDFYIIIIEIILYY